MAEDYDYDLDEDDFGKIHDRHKFSNINWRFKSMSDEKKTNTDIQTPIGRVSWAYVFGNGDPEEDGKCKYKMTLMLPKSREVIAHLGMKPEQEKAYIKKVADFIETFKKAAMEFAKSKYGDKAKNTRWNPLLDGDTKDWEGNKGFWLLRMKSQFKPKVKKPKADEGNIEDGNNDERTGFYTGCWARCFTSFYAYNQEGNKGVAAGLGAVQKAWNDEVFSGGSGGSQFSDDVEELSEEKKDFEDEDLA